MKKEKILLIFTCVCLLVALVSIFLISACSSSSSNSSPASNAASSKTSATPVSNSQYSVSECKVLSAQDIASILGVTAADVTEQPVQKPEAGCIESFIVKLGAIPAPVVVALTDTKASTIYNAEPKLCLANTKKMVAADKPGLGIGDYDSFEMVGGAIMFGKGKYMVQVTCPMGITIDKTTAIAKLVANHLP